MNAMADHAVLEAPAPEPRSIGMRQPADQVSNRWSPQRTAENEVILKQVEQSLAEVDVQISRQMDCIQRLHDLGQDTSVAELTLRNTELLLAQGHWRRQLLLDQMWTGRSAWPGIRDPQGSHGETAKGADVIFPGGRRAGSGLGRSPCA